MFDQVSPHSLSLVGTSKGNGPLQNPQLVASLATPVYPIHHQSHLRIFLPKEQVQLEDHFPTLEKLFQL